MTITQLNKINFDKIEENSFWNFGEQKEIGIHKVHVYPAKFPSHIAQKAFEYCDEKDIIINRVSDIFCGCGTVSVEARRRDYDFYGCDLNPVAVLISKVKSSAYDLQLVENKKKNIIEYFDTHEIKAFYSQANERLKYWFIESQYNELYALKQAIEQCTENDKYRELFYCIFSSILKGTSKWLTKSIKPQVDPKKEIHNVKDSFEKQYKVFIKAIREANFRDNSIVEIEQINVLDIEKKEYVDLIVTSPPYVTSYEYADLHQLSSLWLGYTNNYAELRTNSIGSLYNAQDEQIGFLTDTAKKIVNQFPESAKQRSVARYYSNMNDVMGKAYDLLRIGGVCVVVIGDTEYKGTKIENARCLAESFILNGFEISEISKRKISNKFLPSHRDENGKFTSQKDARKIYSQEYIIIGRKR